MVNMLGSIGVIIISVPLAAKVSKKFGKKEMSIVVFIIAAVIYAVLFFLRPENVWIYVGFTVAA